MIDYELLIISVTSLLFFVVVGGTILLFPLTRKLGHLIEARTRDPRANDRAGEDLLRQVVARLDALEDRVTTLAERQEFADRLLMESRADATLERDKGG